MTEADCRLAAGDWVVRVSPGHGGRIAQVSLAGVDLLVPDDDRVPSRDLLWGCYPMVPWAGRLCNGCFAHGAHHYSMRQNEPPHSLHGLGFDRRWRTVACTTTKVVTELEITDIAPFSAVCEHVVEVLDERVTCTLSVRSLGGAFPAMVGWHPWFSRAWTHDVRFGSMLARDDDNIVSSTRTTPGDEPWDDCFVDALHPPRLHHDDTTIELDSDCDHWMLYTEPDDAFCIEPMSGPPNSLDSSHPRCATVDPAHALARHLTFRVVDGQKYPARS